MKKWLTIVSVLLGFAVYSQNEGLFNRATSAYNEGDYEKAIERYLEILDKGQHSAALYYNLGNSYYKLNQIAPSIYYYEKALLLQPNDPEIKTNLSYAKNMTLDAIEALPETSLSRFYNSIIGLFTFDEWSYVAVGLLLLFVLTYLAFYYLRYSSHKRIAFVTSMISLILVVVCLVFAFMQYRNFETDQPAIVFAQESVVKSEPNQRSTQVFVLHEGTKVNVLDQLEDYKKIQLVDGKTGWIQAEDVKLLKDF
ncbi:MAG: tetratricopeptide repeat protein [Bacteroidota bacterium]